MRRREEIIREIVRGIVDAADDSEVVEISSAIATPLPANVALGLIGLPQAQHERFHQLMDERLAFLLTRGGRGETTTDGLEHFARIRRDMWEIVEPLIAERRRRPEPTPSRRSSRSRTRSARTSSPTTCS